MGVDAVDRALALDLLAARLTTRDDDDPLVAPSMRSRLLRGTPGAGIVILLHGLTASPPAWRAVAQRLYERGRTVVVPRLLHHGHADRMTTALRKLDGFDLLVDIIAIARDAQATGERVTIAGHSLGGTLSIGVAAALPGIDRIVPIAPFLGIARVPHEADRLVFSLMRRLPNVFLWWDPWLRERLMPAHGYPRYPLHAIAHGMRIADAVHSRAYYRPLARAVDMVLNVNESSVNNRTVLRLVRAWRRSGASVAIHQLRGLPWSHDIIEPERPHARTAFDTLVAIIDGDHVAEDRDHIIGDAVVRRG